MTAESQVLELMTPSSEAQVVQRLPVVVTPTHLLAMAYERGAPIEQMERLFALKLQVDADEARKAFNAAFAAFKAEDVHVYRGKKITDGPLKGKWHAELSDIVAASSAPLAKHGLSTSWRLVEDAKDWMRVECTLKHALGHSESVAMGGAPDTGPGRNAIQARGSTKTYLERYTLMALLGLAAEDDDDGAGGAPPPPPPPPAQPAPPVQYDQAAFDSKLPTWTEALTKGRTTAERLIGFIESNGAPLTEAQKATLTKIKKA